VFSFSFLYCYCSHRDLHSFPTRRSSDLVVSVLVSRHLSRSLGTKIGKRVRLSPVVMESTHDLDFVFWLLEPAKPVRVYSQGAYRSEEHTSELQSRVDLVCRLLLEKKNDN